MDLLWGGFGALAAASHVPGARAVAEIPQINVETWIKSAQRQIEAFITKMPLADYRKLHPEQLNLPARFAKAKYIPSFRIITNPHEINLTDQLDFYAWSRLSPLPQDEGPRDLVQTTALKGHAYLSRKEVIPFIQP